MNVKLDSYELHDRLKKAMEYVMETRKSETNDYVIYPFDFIGAMAKRILNDEFGIRERYVVDTSSLHLYNADVKSIDYLKDDYDHNEFIILLCVDPLSKNATSAYQEVTSFANTDRIMDMLSLSTFFRPWTRTRHCLTRENDTTGRDHVEAISREIYANAIDGAVAEAGVYKGGTAKYINAFFPDRKLYLFDSFEGFNSAEQENDDKKRLYNKKVDYTATSVDVVLKNMYWPQNCVIKPGWFPESAIGVEDQFCFVRLDMDLYDPIKAGLEFFYPKMKPGGYIAVHDCRSNNFMGAREALIEFCNKMHLGYVCLSDLRGTAVISIPLV